MSTPHAHSHGSGHSVADSALETGENHLIAWTGERCVPWTGDLQVVYEHYHRYLLAVPHVAGKRVLDLASGEGYGASLLAETARSVVGLEIDPESIRHSKLNYERRGCSFVEGDMRDLSLFVDDSFDVVTCFEALEHIVEQEQLLAEVRRVLRPAGVFLTSTPDRLQYSEHLHQENPYHLRELSLGEFQDLLSSVFPQVAVWGQGVAVGSLVRRIGGERGDTEVLALERDGEVWRTAEANPPTYFVGVASDVPLPPLPANSVLVDVGLEVVRRAEGAAQQARDVAAGAREELAAATQELVAARAELAAQADIRAAADRELERLLVVEHEAQRLRDELAAERATLVPLKQGLDRLATIEQSISYRLTRRYQQAFDRLAPTGSRTRSRYMRVVHRTGAPRAVDDPEAAPAAAPPSLPTSDAPVVSVVVPVHGKWSYTAACLASLAADRPTVPYEVVLVDDASKDDTRARAAAVTGLRVVALDDNVGFLRACNRGVAEAGGRFVVLLNNDTTVRPGWLDALVSTAEEHLDAGVVGAKLVYPDGRLQEAGGIVFRDGTGWNYGRFDNPDEPQYEFLREVDYCSGAAILVRRELLDAVGGGFDERFVPAYYEDTDLCFEARRHGYRVLYQPLSVVVHHEGISHGTDIASGVKRHQELNRVAFLDKWQHELAQQHENDPGVVAVARQRDQSGHVVVVDHHVPLRDQDSGSLRMFHVLRLLREAGHPVTFVPENRARMEPYATELMQLGIEVVYGHRDVAQYLAQYGDYVELAVVSRMRVANDYLALLQKALPRAAIVYDTVDLHFLRERRQAEVEHDTAVRVIADQHQATEVSLAQTADATLVVADYEAEALREVAPGVRVLVLPNVHELPAAVPTLDGRSGLLFVGGFRHRPNIDAVRWFVEDVLPLVRESLPDVVLRVVGPDVPLEIAQLSGPGVEILGWVRDLAPLHRESRVFIAPLRYGAGIKGKVGEALAQGLPVVTTRVGAEGMGLEHGVEVLVADEPEAFCRQIVRAYEDADLWAALQTAGRDVVRRQYSPAVVGEALAALYAEVTAARRGGTV